MTREELFRAVGEVREDQIAEAEHLKKQKHYFSSGKMQQVPKHTMLWETWKKPKKL